MPRRILILLAVFSMLLAGCYANAFAEALPAEEENDYGLIPSGRIEIPDYTQETVKTFEIREETDAILFVRNIHAGWNLGNTFDANDGGGYNPNKDYETYWQNAKTSKELIHAIHEAGFNLLRIPVSWHNHLIDDAYTIDPKWLDRVKEVADWALAEDMYVIINIHHDNSKNYLYPDSEHYEQSEHYITAIWRQVSEAFADYDEHVIFESMNEPRLVGNKNYEWQPNESIPVVRDAMICINKLNQKFVETVRSSGGNNATRYLMIPGYCGSVGGVTANVFEVPEDDRIIIEVHAYTPYNFALNTKSKDSSFDLEKDTAKKSEIATFMTKLFNRYIVNGVPVIIDEFGALKKTDGDLQARVNFAAYYTAMASTRGIPVVWWDNAAFSGGGEKFGLIDRKKVEWRYPDIALAIITNCRVNR